VAAGVAVRAWQYLANASLGVDEAALARNIIGRPVFALFARLDFGQVAPPGFLLVEKAAVLALGDSEFVLRLFPFVCGLASLPLFHEVAKHFLERGARVLAVALFSLGLPFVYYSSQVKPYAGDVAAALVVPWLAIGLRERDVTRRRALMFASAGVVLPWFSYGAAFALIGTAIFLMVHAVDDRSRLRQTLCCVVPWTVSAGVAAAVASRNLSSADAAFMQRYWAAGFMPAGVSNGDALRWMWNSVQGVYGSFSNAPPTLDGGMHFRRPWIFALLTVCGAAALMFRRRAHAALLLAPLVVVLAASAAHRYPFAGRVALFVVPSLLIPAAAGADFIARVASRVVGPLAVGVFAVLAVFPLYAVVTNHPPDRQEHLRPVMEYVARHRHASDPIYVYYGAAQGFLYYAARHGFRDGEYEVGRCAMDEPRSYLADVDRLRGNSRVWMIFSHSLQGAREIRLIVGYLDAVGRRLEAVPPVATNAQLSAGAYAFLYDLSGVPSPAVTRTTYAVPADWNTRSRAWLCYGPMTPMTSSVDYARSRSRISFRRRRSFRLARRIAPAMNGANSLENPVGSPRFRNVIRVAPPIDSHV
jgi:hypothetical protein